MIFISKKINNWYKWYFCSSYINIYINEQYTCNIVLRGLQGQARAHSVIRSKYFNLKIPPSFDHRPSALCFRCLKIHREKPQSHALHCHIVINGRIHLIKTFDIPIFKQCIVFNCVSRKALFKTVMDLYAYRKIKYCTIVR